MRRTLWVSVFVMLVASMLLTGSRADACMCLTRTPGFWGTHPDITLDYLSFDLKEYLPVCGFQISSVDASACSAIQAMCVNATDSTGQTPQLLQLIRQITAARLNLRATWTVGGGCTTELEQMVASCDQTCRRTVRGVIPYDNTAITDCIDELNMFNNMMDTLSPYGPFLNPGAASTAACRASSGDQITILSCTNLD